MDGSVKKPNTNHIFHFILILRPRSTANTSIARTSQSYTPQNIMKPLKNNEIDDLPIMGENNEYK